MLSPHEVRDQKLNLFVSARTKLHEENLLATNGLQRLSMTSGVTTEWMFLGSD